MKYRGIAKPALAIATAGFLLTRIASVGVAVCWSIESQLSFIAVPLTATIIIPLVSPKTS